ncbi:MAG: hypothetical protein LBI19_06270 [Oscillospiraceae bacterium]|nr:hypothetical protein [Oscillospiraceae bacterium]
MRKNHIAIIAVCIAAAIVCGGIAGSFRIALALSGLHADYMEVDADFDANGKQIKILWVYSEEPAWAYMQRNVFGIWSVEYTGIRAISWLKPVGMRRFSARENPITEFESHVYYYGNDATMLIDPYKLALPHNVHINVRQAGKEYWIHWISFLGEEPSGINIRQLLLDAGFIS